MNAPLSSSGRSVITAVALVICSLAPARATDVAETAPKIITDPEVLESIDAIIRRARSHISAEEARDAGRISSEEAFKLWNNCQPIAFSLHLQGENEASKIGLTKEAVETAVRSCLRSARIFKDDPRQEACDISTAES